MDDYGLDGQKLILHPARVAAVLAGRSPAPLLIEISPTTRCNLACRFCGLNYRRDLRVDFPWPALARLVTEFRATGGAAVCISGEGDPLLYPQLPALLRRCRRLGLAVGVVTNGIGLTPAVMTALIGSATWVKISLNALRASTYSRLHGVSGATAAQALTAMRALVRARRQAKSPLTIGVQAILLPENAAELVALARAARAAGADYFVVKPYNHHPHSRHRALPTVGPARRAALATALAGLRTARFWTELRARAFAKLTRSRQYPGCPGHRFFACVAADGGLYPCAVRLGDARFRFGNVITDGFRAVWSSRRRQRISRQLARPLSGCMPGCRLDEINRYLRRLQMPRRHDMFI